MVFFAKCLKISLIVISNSLFPKIHITRNKPVIYVIYPDHLMSINENKNEVSGER